MRGYCFTFGGYRKLDAIDTCQYPITFLREKDDELKIKCCLSHPIFGIEGVMGTVRDYMSCGALLPIDLFSPRVIDSNEIYQMLYSVACCKKCTEDVVSLLRRYIRPLHPLLSMTSSPMGLSAEQILHLIYRCRFFEVEENVDVYYSLYFPEGYPQFIHTLILRTQIYRDLRYKVSSRSYEDSRPENSISEGIKLRVTDGKDMRNLVSPQIRYGEVPLDGEELIAVIMSGKRSYLKRVKRMYGTMLYYRRTWSLISYALFLSYPPSWRVLGQEEMVVLSMSTYMRVGVFAFLPKIRKREEELWALPRMLLQRECRLLSEEEGQRITILYEGKNGDLPRKYTICLKKNDKGEIEYMCGNSVTYSYYMLLVIIVKRFIFTDDREYLANALLQLIDVEEESIIYLDTLTALPPIHDLITPPDIFHFKDKDPIMIPADPHQIFI